MGVVEKKKSVVKFLYYKNLLIHCMYVINGTTQKEDVYKWIGNRRYEIKLCIARILSWLYFNPSTSNVNSEL